MENRKNFIETLNSCHTPSSILDLLADFVSCEGNLDGFSTFTPAIYDTAWLSMVCRTCNDGTVQWLFPGCWEYILKTQNEDGTWPSYSSPIDSILNSLASLLALLRRQETDRQKMPRQQVSQSDRIQKAQNGIQSLLSAWDVERTIHVGFEILVPRLLQQISEYGISFSFPDSEHLDTLFRKKSKKFTPELLYQSTETTLLHSVEALITLVDFEKIKHHCGERSGILASPAATAAYLMHVEDWDDSAENYLKAAQKWYGSGVSSAFPTEIFELSWAITTLVPRAIRVEDLKDETLRSLRSYFRSLVDGGNGLVGFTQGVLPDADDTSRVLLAQAVLGSKIDVQPLIERFERETHFCTYQIEGHASPSANCNVLLALLESEHVMRHLSTIEKILHFLEKRWELGRLEDKWNLDKNYVYMIMTDAFIRLLHKQDDSIVQFHDEYWGRERIIAIIVQILSRVLKSQNLDGSWHSIERTAYSVITILQCLSLPWTSSIREVLSIAISQGRAFIQSSPLENGKVEDYCWVEKVSYGSALLRRTYTLCALHSPSVELSWTRNTIDIFATPDSSQSHAVELLFSQTPLVKNNHISSLGLMLIQAKHYASNLRELGSNIFPDDEVHLENSRYIDFIPLFWLICDNISDFAITPKISWEMLVASLFIYQADEYMEKIVAQLSSVEIDMVMGFLAGPSVDSSNQNDSLKSGPRTTMRVIQVLDKFKAYFLNHPDVAKSPKHIRKELAVEISRFFLAHLTHILNNRQLCQSLEGPKTYSPNGVKKMVNHVDTTYLDWVRTTGADDTSCPFAFLFFSCLISSDGRHCLSQSARMRYISTALSRHLATMCRQYNDLGSTVRDIEECNLNSLDFPEFCGSGFRSTIKNGEMSEDKQFLDQAKQELKDIAEFERGSMEFAFQSLQSLPNANQDTLRKLMVFINVTDLWGQLYVIKDITNKIRSYSVS